MIPTSPSSPETRALIVGIDPMQRRKLNRRIEESGFGPVLEAEDLNGAAQHLSSVLISTVFVLGGGEAPTVKQIRNLLRNRGPNRGAAVVLLTGERDGPLAVAAVKAGAAAVLPPLPEREALAGLANPGPGSAAADRGKNGRQTRGPLHENRP